MSEMERRILDPVGNRGRGENPQKFCCEEAQLPPHGKRGSAAQRRGRHSAKDLYLTAEKK